MRASLKKLLRGESGQDHSHPNFIMSRNLQTRDWLHTAFGEESDDNFGTSIAMSSDGLVVAVGAPNARDTNNGNDSGSVTVFKYDGSTYIELNTFYGIDDNARFGKSIALSNDGGYLAVGAPKSRDTNRDETGSVTVFQYNTASDDYTQLGSAIHGVAQGDLFGSSIALSNDGGALAVGAPVGRDTNEDKTGSVTVFEYNGSTYTKLGSAIYGVGNDDLFGTSVALSSEGSKLAVGAPKTETNGAKTGSVQIYELVSLLKHDMIQLSSSFLSSHN